MWTRRQKPKKARWLQGAPALAVLCIGLVSPAAAQESYEEFWPELNIYWRMDAVTRLYFLSAPTINRQESYGEAQYGAHVEFGVAPIFRRQFGETYDIDRFRILRFRVGMRYGSNFAWSQSEYTEWRGVLELTARYLLPEHVLLSLRSRVELRWLNSDYSTRFRTRIAVERDTPITSSWTIVPFAKFELFYDSRFAVWNRTQAKFGLGIPVVGPLVVDVSYVYQHDIRSTRTYINALGLAANLYF